MGPMKIAKLVVGAALAACLPALAQDAERGARLYADTAKLTGKPVATCVSCHADTTTLRELLRNRGGHCDDPAALARWIEAVIGGAQPGAVNAKAQYRGVLKPKDVRDLAAYIACAKQARLSATRLAATVPR
jgi:cytochrome c553